MLRTEGLELSAWLANERHHVLRQELTEEEERVYVEMAGEAIDGEVDAWKRFKPPSPMEIGA